MHKDMYYSHWFIQLCVPHRRHINFLMQKSCLLSIPLDTQTSSLSIMNRIHHMYSSFIPIIRCFLVLWKPLLILFCVVSWVLLFLYWAIWWWYPTTTPRNSPQIKLFFFTWKSHHATITGSISSGSGAHGLRFYSCVSPRTHYSWLFSWWIIDSYLLHVLALNVDFQCTYAPTTQIL